MSKRNSANVGGQALIEGILMRGPKGAVMALRLPDGTIEVEPKKEKRLKDKYKVFAWPLLRGVAGFIESMVFGYKCLMESADKSGFEENDEDLSKFDVWINEKLGDKFMSVVGVLSLVFGLLLSFGLFVYLPVLAVDMFDKYLTGNTLLSWHPFFEGLLRVIILVIYMASVSRMKEIKRVFMYHGAEHKSIYCYENGEELTLENVKKQSRFHPRCGTSYLFVMVFVGILVSTVTIKIFPGLNEIRWLWTLVKVLIMPVIMGLGYELLKISGRYDNLFTKIISAPGLWMQRLTTQEPTDDIIEVGIASLKAVIDDPNSGIVRESASGDDSYGTINKSVGNID
ncbi:MAG: DUF1385 domain-containing protein [Oscillospiraceae bacterium]|jgi:uncharacterized protein YqhQ|nr:DUF1385 domain-containing protein [Oscillospiraceae bacterium]